MIFTFFKLIDVILVDLIKVLPGKSSKIDRGALDFRKRPQEVRSKSIEKITPHLSSITNAKS